MEWYYYVSGASLFSAQADRSKHSRCHLLYVVKFLDKSVRVGVLLAKGASFWVIQKHMFMHLLRCVSTLPSPTNMSVHISKFIKETLDRPTIK